MHRNSYKCQDQKHIQQCGRYIGRLLELDEESKSMMCFAKVTMLIATEQPSKIQDSVILNIKGINYEVIVNEVKEPSTMRSRNAKGSTVMNEVMQEEVTKTIQGGQMIPGKKK